MKFTSRSARRPKDDIGGRPHKKRLDWRAILFALPFAYTSVIHPISIYVDKQPPLGVYLEAGIADRLFWPGLAFCAIALVILRQRLGALIRTARVPQMQALFCLLLLAAVSALWSSSPETTLVRFASQCFITAFFVAAATLLRPDSDYVRAIYIVFAVGVVLNIGYVSTQSPNIVDGVNVGYSGYFGNKNSLGFFASFAFLFSLFNMRRSALRIGGGLVVIGASVVLLVMSKSKGALVFAIASPFVAFALLLVYRKLRISPAVSVTTAASAFLVISLMVGDLPGRISMLMYGNPTLSNRTAIWEFIDRMVSIRPMLGWGYRSFWLVPEDILARYPAEAWIKLMPHGHNGYLDMKVELGYVGYGLLLWLLAAVFYQVGKIADRDMRSGWMVATIALFIVLMNFVESSWLRGADPLWLPFLVAIAEGNRSFLAQGRS